MKKEDIRLNDVYRILFGDAPAEFLIEVLARSVITYLVLLTVLRVLGKRMSGRITNAEMAVMLMFGAIVSSAMQIPDRGILQGIAALLLVLVFHRLFTTITNKSEKLETVFLGHTTMLIKDGVMMKEALREEKISRNQLFRLLRSEKIINLGKVKRMYMETNSSFSIYKNKEERAGLAVLPEKDAGTMRLVKPDKEKKACNTCGTVYTIGNTPSHCGHCNGDVFVQAYL